jgi:hypothetical protein
VSDFGLDCDPKTNEGLSQKDFVYVTPSPVLARLERLDDRVLGLMKVFGGVLVLGRITTTHMAADQTLPQVNPTIAHLEALFAAVAAGIDFANLFYVGTGLRV